jgi:hypothetical protein
MSNEVRAAICVFLAVLLLIAISFRSVFLADVARLYRHGLLLRVCLKVMTNPWILCIYATTIAVLYIFFSPKTAKDTAAAGVSLVFLSGFLFSYFIANSITPLCFGTFVVGRLNRKYRVGFGQFRRRLADFTVISSGEPVTVNVNAGNEGKAYLLIVHPAEPSIVLPIIDDNPSYMQQIGISFATDERRQEIMAEITRLREKDN